MVLWILWTPSAGAQLQSLPWNLDKGLQASRWVYDSSVKPQLQGGALQLYELKKAYKSKKFKQCWEQEVSIKMLSDWVLLYRSRCALEQQKIHGGFEGPLGQTVQSIWATSDWLLSPAAEEIKNVLIEGQLRLINVQVRNDRAAAWKLIDQLLSRGEWLSNEQKADVYKQAGELAFVEQNLDMAKDFLIKSLAYQESAELRRRLESLGGEAEQLENAAVVQGSPVGEQSFVGAGEEELELERRMKRSLESGDMVSVVEDGVQLLRKFPGGVRASWASDRILNIYLGVASRKEERLRLAKGRILKEMQKVDGARIYRWANNAYVRGHYVDALELAEVGMTRLEGHPDLTAMTVLGARAAVHAGNYKAAQKLFELLAVNHVGSEESAEALFRLGLIHLREQDYSAAAARFERLLALTYGQDFEYRTLYWYWRSQQKLGIEGASATALRLIQKYPITYYGLRARAELNDNKLVWTEEELKSLSGEVRLTSSQMEVWQRIELLLKAGWLTAARQEIARLPDPSHPKDKIFRAYLQTQGFDYFNAIRMLNQAWNEDSGLLLRSTLELGFPRAFSLQVENEAKNYNLDSALVYALIRQESSFRVDAQSPAQAMGLMQLVPVTAREVAQNLSLRRNLQLPEDMYDPDLNIRFGTYYMSRMVRAFKGHVPLALAAYNAGIGRMRRWLAARPDLGDIEAKPSSLPENEIWIDELPWTETRLYVKSIMRNWIIYKMLEEGELTLKDPLWSRNL